MIKNMRLDCGRLKMVKKKQKKIVHNLLNIQSNRMKLSQILSIMVLNWVS